MRILRVKNWDRYQHYKDRCPPWIKLATDTFQNYEFSRLSDASKLLAICIWTLASRSKAGEVPEDFDYLKAQGCLGSMVKPDHLKELITQGFLEIASNPLANCTQNACSEREGETETETERETEERRDSSEIVGTTPSTPIAELRFPCNGKVKVWNVTEELIAQWRELFPAVDVLAECRAALSWALANPKKRKTAGGMEAFLSRWLTKTQDRAGSGPTTAFRRPTSSKTAGNVDVIRDWLDDRAAKKGNIG